MAIITISRELAALGDETAQELAKLLHYRFVDKHSLEETIKSYGVSDRKLEKYDERKPSFIASLSQDRDDYIHYLKTAMLSETQKGSCVFIGRGAGAIFKNIPGVLSVFLVAPFDIRCERVKSYFHCDDRRARQIIERSDHDREGYHSYFFDMQWKDPSNYHLALNTGYLHPTTGAKLIKSFREEMITGEMEADGELRLKEMLLGQQVVHHILYEKGIPIHFLEATVDEKTVVLFGVASSQVLVEAAVAAARIPATGYTLRSEIQVVQEYNVIP
ncbi:MAG: cytidylate kinase-like family protein [Spirochaetaceae bacterium]|jgi:cytidylate kinase|nr:cytidylate kinase-like family protein [Spirochaetaceae bacterium]